MPLKQQLTITTRWKGNGEGAISFLLSDIDELIIALNEVETAASEQAYGKAVMLNITQNEVSVTGFLQ